MARFSGRRPPRDGRRPGLRPQDRIRARFMEFDITANHHTLANDYVNNASYNNHPDFNMLGITSGGGRHLPGGPAEQHRPRGHPAVERVRGERYQQLLAPGRHAVRRAVPECVDLWMGRSSPSGRRPARAAPPAPRAEQHLLDRGVGDVGLPCTGQASHLGVFESGAATTMSTVGGGLVGAARTRSRPRAVIAPQGG